MIAHRLGIDPYEMRRRNLIDLGEAFVPGESGMDSDLREGLDLVVRELGYRRRGELKDEGPVKRGMGLAIGFKDGGGVNKPALARVKVSTGGDIFLQCGTAEVGQGAHTALSAVVAERLGADRARVRYMPVDTDHSPFDQGTNASSAISVMGQAVDRAALAARRQILDFAAGMLDCPAEELDLVDWEIRRGNEAHPLAPMVMGHFGGTGWESRWRGLPQGAYQPRRTARGALRVLGDRLGRRPGRGRYRNRQGHGRKAVRHRRRRPGDPSARLPRPGRGRRRDGPVPGPVRAHDLRWRPGW